MPECDFDFIGVQFVPRLISVELLSEFDLIITIGRTVQYCFAMGVPVYVYDYFGGPGYIDESNFELAEKCNFSGRGFGKKSVDDLISEIFNEYQNAVFRLEKLHSVAQQEYSYDKQFDIIYNEFIKLDSKYKIADYYNSKIERGRIKMYCDLVPGWVCKNNYRSQLFFDYGDGFCEENSVSWNAIENYTVSRHINLDGRIRGLRFDPCDEPCECEIMDVLINGKSELDMVVDSPKYFLTFDPQFIFKLSEKNQQQDVLKIELVYRFRVMDKRDVVDLCDNIINEMNIRNAMLEEERKKSKKLGSRIFKRIVKDIK